MLDAPGPIGVHPPNTTLIVAVVVIIVLFVTSRLRGRR